MDLTMCPDSQSFNIWRLYLISAHDGTRSSDLLTCDKRSIRKKRHHQYSLDRKDRNLAYRLTKFNRRSDISTEVINSNLFVPKEQR